MSVFQIYPQTEELNKMYCEYKHLYLEGDSGIDLLNPNDVLVPANSTVLVDLQVKCQLKNNLLNTYYSYFLMPRSSIYKTPLIMCNSVGLIDSSYCGNLKSPFFNTSRKDFLIVKGTRLVQIAKPNLEHSNTPQFIFGAEPTKTERNCNGFGSTGS